MRTSYFHKPLSRGFSLFLLKFLQKMVSPVSVVTISTLDQRVGKNIDMARGLPDGFRQNNGRIQSDNITPSPDNFFPPLMFYIFLQLDAQGPIIPG
jgi:hypothetical protein